MGFAKPDGRIFDRMSRPGKAEVLMVGDSLSSDIRGGIHYGIDTCWFNPLGKPAEEMPATYEIRQLRELLRIVGID